MDSAHRIDGVLVDLLMAVMNSIETWSAAAGDKRLGLAWRDSVTARMVRSGRYVPYEGLVVDAAAEHGLPATAAAELIDQWARMEPWPDAVALGELRVPFGFVTNCSRALAELAVARSGVEPRVTLSAEDIGWFKPQPATYGEGCRRLGSAPNRTAFVAGAPYDAEGARDAGLDAFLVIRRPDLPAPSSGVRVARSLGEIIAAINVPSSQAGT